MKIHDYKRAVALLPLSLLLMLPTGAVAKHKHKRISNNNIIVQAPAPQAQPEISGILIFLKKMLEAAADQYGVLTALKSTLGDLGIDVSALEKTSFDDLKHLTPQSANDLLVTLSGGDTSRAQKLKALLADPTFLQSAESSYVNVTAATLGDAQTAYARTPLNAKRIESLTHQIPKTQSVKASIDLNSRLSSQNALLTDELIKLQAAANELQSVKEALTIETLAKKRAFHQTSRAGVHKP